MFIIKKSQLVLFKYRCQLIKRIWKWCDIKSIKLAKFLKCDEILILLLVLLNIAFKTYILSKHWYSWTSRESGLSFNKCFRNMFEKLILVIIKYWIFPRATHLEVFSTYRCVCIFLADKIMCLLDFLTNSINRFFITHKILSKAHSTG